MNPLKSSKSRISALETSKKPNFQNWTPFGCRSPESKSIVILLKLPDYDVVTLVREISRDLSKMYKRENDDTSRNFKRKLLNKKLDLSHWNFIKYNHQK